MKKIAVDLRSIESPTGKRGVGYFNRQLFETLLSNPHPNFQFNLLTFPKSSLVNKFKIGPIDKFKSVTALYWPKKGLRKLDPFFSFVWSNALRQIKPDLIHIPFLFELYYLSVPTNIKSVVTLYDIIPLKFPKQYFQNEKAKDWYKQRLEQAKRASKIITISKSSKADIEKMLKIPSEKIAIIYGGVDKRFRKLDQEKAKEKFSQKYKIKNPYILTVSTHSFHKNTSRIFQAFKEYISSTKNFDLTLVVVCKLIPKEERDWREELRKLDIEKRVILTNFVSDEDLPAIYSGAEVFLFPSLYEGLGLPVLEAMACGTAVITANVSSMPEVGGDAPLYVDPQSVSSIRRSIAKVLNDSSFKEQMVKKGFNQVKKFSWEKTSSQTLQVYQEVLRNGH